MGAGRGGGGVKLPFPSWIHPCTWMSVAAAGICLLKCFCRCFCWTFNAKPEPRIPYTTFKIESECSNSNTLACSWDLNSYGKITTTRMVKFIGHISHCFMYDISKESFLSYTSNKKMSLRFYYNFKQMRFKSTNLLCLC